MWKTCRKCRTTKYLATPGHHICIIIMSFVEMDGRILKVEYIGLWRSPNYPNSVQPDMDSRPRHSEFVSVIILLQWKNNNVKNNMIGNSCTGVRHSKNYSASQKSPWGLVAIFPKRLGIFQANFTCLLCVPIYARLRIFIQLPATLTKLCHIKRDHPVHIMFTPDLTIQTLYYMALLHLTCINFKWYKTLWLELSLALLVQ